MDYTPEPEHERWRDPMTREERLRFIADHVREWENPKPWLFIGELIEEVREHGVESRRLSGPAAS